MVGIWPILSYSKMKDIIEYLASGIIDLGVWIIVGLLGLVGLFGKRQMKKWDELAESHVPVSEINRRFNIVYADMHKCQEDLKNQQDKILEKVDKVHSRIDEVYILMVKGKK